MPMGAVIFVDFWLMKKFGLRSSYAEASGVKINWAAGIAWIATVAICLTLVWSGNPMFQRYFVSLPGWFIAAIMYIVLSKLFQKKTVAGEA
jgi:purine-cytosine permease-like protein